MSYKSDLVVPVPKEEQYRVKDAHEPIIDRETWEIVQRIRAQKRRPVKMGEPYLLSGMVFCADCGHVFHLNRSRDWDESKYIYVCGTYHNHKDKCTPHTIKALHLRQLALAAIQEVWAQVREGFSSRILDRKSEQAKKELAANHKILAQTKKRLDELSELMAKAFEKMVADILTDEQFQQLSERYSTEQRECKARIPQLETELEEQEGVDRFLAVVDQYLDIQGLTPEILHEFVESIVVHEPSERWKKKNYTQKVDIYFNYIGNLE